MKLLCAAVLSVFASVASAHDFLCSPIEEGLKFIENNSLSPLFEGKVDGLDGAIYIFTQEETGEWVAMSVDNALNLMCFVQAGQSFVLLPQGEEM